MLHTSVSEYSDVYSLAESMLHSLEKLRIFSLHDRLGNKGEDSIPRSEWIPREIIELTNKCTNFSRIKCFFGGNRHGRPSCNEFIERLQSMRSAGWMDEVIQNYVQHNEDPGPRQTTDQATKDHYHGCTRPLYEAARSWMAEAAYFVKARFKRKQPNVYEIMKEE